ncbi:MAG: hypothetical protein P8Y05_15335, partial [Deinococcales bacterium]
MSTASATSRHEDHVEGRSLLQDAARRFRHHPTGILGLAIIVFFVAITILAPVLRPVDPLKINLRDRMLPPTWTMSQQELEQKQLHRWSFPFGTDVQ